MRWVVGVVALIILQVALVVWTWASGMWVLAALNAACVIVNLFYNLPTFWANRR